MAQFINFGKGTSGSPNAISGVINTYATCTGTAGQTVLTTALAASDGDQILIHQTQHATAAGTWEIVKVSSDAGATLNLATALVNSYTTGAQCVLIPQYTGGDISGAVTGTAWNGTTGGIIALMSNGDLTVSGSIAINGSNAKSQEIGGGQVLPDNGGGFRGGWSDDALNSFGLQGESQLGAGGQSSSANGNGGGAGGGNGNFNTGGGGGNGAVGVAGSGSSATNGSAGGTSGVAQLTTMTFGGGGGGATGVANSAQSSGANGGGIILIIAKNFTLSGSLSTNGGSFNGTNYPISGGAGAGGSVLIKSQIVALGTNLITASGGTITNSNTQKGGAGGVGRIRCDYFTSVSGSTTPTLSSAQDLTLNLPSSNFFAFF